MTDGITIASDDVSGTQFPVVKLDIGSSGTSSLLSAGGSALPITLDTLIAGEDITNNLMNTKLQAGTLNAATATVTNTVRTQTRFAGTLLTTGGTYTLHTGAGVCHLMTVMGGTAGTIGLYDGTSGTTGVKFGDFDSSNQPATYGFNRDLTTGLTVILGTTTKVYVSYGTSS